jgi:hypothetical protein
MKFIIVNLKYNNQSGFANQMYSLSHSIYYAIQNNINFIFIKPFLNQIHTNSYSNISEILDLYEFNKYLAKYNIQIADYFNFKFTLDNISYGYNNYLIDIMNDDNFCFKNNKIHISTNFSFSNFSTKLINYYKQYFIDLSAKLCKLHIKYTLDGKQNIISYNLENNYLKNEILIDFNIVNDYIFTVFCKELLYYDIRTNIIFNKQFSDDIKHFKSKYINNNKINCIHLRLEDDAINHWSKEYKETTIQFKNRVEELYILNIKENIKKDELTLILSSDYNNNIITFLKNNNYNIVLTPKFSEYREKSAIYDFHISQLCNNVYIGVYESSFSYFILYKIKEQINKFCQINFNNYSDAT